MPRLDKYESLSFEEIMELTLKETILNVCYDFMTFQTHGGTAFYTSDIESARKELINQFEGHRNSLIHDEISTLQYYKEVSNKKPNNIYTKRDIYEARRDLKKLRLKMAFLEDTVRWIEQLNKVDIGNFEYMEESKINGRSQLNVLIHDLTELSKMYDYSKNMYPYLRHQTQGGNFEPIVLNSKHKFNALFYENYARRLWESMQYGCLMHIPKENEFLDLDSRLEKMYERIIKVPKGDIIISNGSDGETPVLNIIKMPETLTEGDYEAYGLNIGVKKIFFGAPGHGFGAGIYHHYAPNDIAIVYSKSKNYISEDFTFVQPEKCEIEIRNALSQFNLKNISFWELPKKFLNEFFKDEEKSYDKDISKIVSMIDKL